MKIESINYQQNFKKIQFKGLTEAIDVWNESKPTIKEALKEVGDKNIAILMHGNSFPSNIFEDIGIGSPYAKGAEEFAQFFSGIIDKCVLGPWGITKGINKHSPYNSTLESLNPFFINFKYLTTKDGGSLISAETFFKVVKNNQNNDNQVNYEYVEKSVNILLDEAYETYKQRLENNNIEAINLQQKIKDFKNENFGIYLDVVFNSLSSEYETLNFNTWDEIDKKLPLLLEEKDPAALKRLAVIDKIYKKDIEKYLFVQYLAKVHKKFAPLKYVADKQVSIESNDAWKLQDILLTKIGTNDISLGVPPDSFSSSGRCWGMPVIDVNKVFKDDGTLSKGGNRLFNIFRNVFRENKGGVRIDHFQGIIDPFVCINGSPELKDGATRFLSSPFSSLFADYSIVNQNNIDNSRKVYEYKYIKNLTQEQIDKYAKFFEEVILTAAKMEGLDESNIMPEDLGAITKPTIEVMKKNHLGSMKVTQFVKPNDAKHEYRGINSKPNDFITNCTHDGKPIISFFEDLSNEKYQTHLEMLVTDLGLKRPLSKNDRMYGLKLKFAELFIAPAKNVQIFFTSLLGLSDWYNKPGDKTVKKWSLRMPNNFKEIYLKNLAKGIAFNPYDAISRALKAKDAQKHKFIINKLKNYEKKLIRELKR